MRKHTQNFVAALGLGVISVSYAIGAANASNSGQLNTDMAAPTAAPVATAAPTQTAAAAPAVKKAAVKKTTVKKTTTKKAAAKKTVKKSSSSSGSSVTKKSKTVGYKYGNVQLSVTKSGGQITAIKMLQADATNGRGAVFPDLISYAKSANGTGFGNIGGATYTTEAFKAALDSALGKF